MSSWNFRTMSPFTILSQIRLSRVLWTNSPPWLLMNSRLTIISMRTRLTHHKTVPPPAAPHPLPKADSQMPPTRGTGKTTEVSLLLRIRVAVVHVGPSQLLDASKLRIWFNMACLRLTLSSSLLIALAISITTAAMVVYHLMHLNTSSILVESQLKMHTLTLLKTEHALLIHQPSNYRLATPRTSLSMTRSSSKRLSTSNPSQ